MVLRGSKTSPDSVQDALASRRSTSPPTNATDQQQQPQQRGHQTDLERIARQLTAGGAAGAIARTVVAPLDRVKILMQCQRLLDHGQAGAKAAASASIQSMPALPRPPAALAAPAMQMSVIPMPNSFLSNGTAAPAAPREVKLGQDRYHRLLQTMKLVAREEGGIRNLWRGNMTNVLRVMPYSAIQFASYDYLKARLLAFSISTHPNSQKARLNTFERLGCGAGAAVIATAFTYPLDNIRLRQTVDPSVNGMRAATAKILAESGSRGLWQGLGATMWSLTPFIAINFAAFDGLKSALAGPEPHRALTTLSLGAASGLLAQTICYPLDTARRRMQLPRQPYTSMSNAISRILREEGLRAMYAGMGANATKVIPLAAIRFLAYEQIKQILSIEARPGGGGD